MVIGKKHDLDEIYKEEIDFIGLEVNMRIIIFKTQ